MHFTPATTAVLAVDPTEAAGGAAAQAELVGMDLDPLAPAGELEQEVGNSRLSHSCCKDSHTKRLLTKRFPKQVSLQNVSVTKCFRNKMYP
jgi:hypothetical protein